MADCCEDKGCAIDALRERQSGTLKVALAINVVMFVVEAAGGFLLGGVKAEERAAHGEEEIGIAEIGENEERADISIERRQALDAGEGFKELL